jgi:RNA polymerase sigma-70 factor (ECF subfamily)
MVTFTVLGIDDNDRAQEITASSVEARTFARAADGADDEFDNVFRRDLADMIPHMRAFARWLCRDQSVADDLAQEALLRAWQARRRFTRGTNLRAWVLKILRNCFNSQRRRAAREVQFDLGKAEQTLIATDDPNAPLLMDDFARALGCLNQDQREALLLVGANGCSYEEVAEITGAPVATVKTRVFRARAKLIQVLDGAPTRRWLKDSTGRPASAQLCE